VTASGGPNRVDPQRDVVTATTEDASNNPLGRPFSRIVNGAVSSLINVGPARDCYVVVETRTNDSEVDARFRLALLLSSKDRKTLAGQRRNE